MDVKLNGASNDENVQRKLDISDSQKTFTDLSAEEISHLFEKSCNLIGGIRFVLKRLQRDAAAIIIQRWFRRESIIHFLSDCTNCNIKGYCMNPQVPPRVSSFTLTRPNVLQQDLTPITEIEENNKFVNTNVMKSPKQLMDSILKDLVNIQLGCDLETEINVYQMLDNPNDDDPQPSETSATTAENDTPVDEESSIAEELNAAKEPAIEPSPCIRCGDLFIGVPSKTQGWSQTRDKNIKLSDIVLQYIKKHKSSLSCQKWFTPSTENFYDGKGAHAPRNEIGRKRRSIDEAISHFLEVQTDFTALQIWGNTAKKNKIIARHLRNHIAAFTIQRWYRLRKFKQRSANLKDPFLTFLLRNKSPYLLQTWFKGSEWKRQYILELLKKDLGNNFPVMKEQVRKPTLYMKELDEIDLSLIDEEETKKSSDLEERQNKPADETETKIFPTLENEQISAPPVEEEEKMKATSTLGENLDESSPNETERKPPVLEERDTAIPAVEEEEKRKETLILEESQKEPSHDEATTPILEIENVTSFPEKQEKELSSLENEEKPSTVCEAPEATTVETPQMPLITSDKLLNSTPFTPEEIKKVKDEIKAEEKAHKKCCAIL